MQSHEKGTKAAPRVDCSVWRWATAGFCRQGAGCSQSDTPVEAGPEEGRAAAAIPSAHKGAQLQQRPRIAECTYITDTQHSHSATSRFTPL